MKGYFEVLLVYSSASEKRQSNIVRRFSTRKLANAYREKQVLGSILYNDVTLFSISETAYIPFDDILAKL